MKMSFMTFVCPKWDIDEIITGAKRYGYNGIEFRAACAHKHGVELEARPEFKKEVRKKFKDNRIEISCLATSCSFGMSDKVRRRENVEDMKRYIELARDLGAFGIRVFGGQIPEEIKLTDGLKYVAEALSSVAEFARVHNVMIYLETHDEFVFSMGEIVGRVIKMVNHPYVQINWDEAHCLAHNEPLERTYESIRPYVKHCHVHDFYITRPLDGKCEDWKPARFGEGDLH